MQLVLCNVPYAYSTCTNLTCGIPRDFLQPVNTDVVVATHNYVVVSTQTQAASSAGGHRSMLSKNKYLLAMMDGRFAGATGRAFLTL